jgi:hypothetical protein
MKTLFNGAGPVGCWIALIIHISSKVPKPKSSLSQGKIIKENIA